MSSNIQDHLGSVDRSVTSRERDGKSARAVTLSRLFNSTIDDLWDALTNLERLPRWFLPAEGEFRPGGRYQLEGNAGGTILRCEAPTTLELTWEFGGETSWVEIWLTAEGSGHTRLTLVHTSYLNENWVTYGSGAAGIGWELGFAGLALHLADPSAAFDEEGFSASPDGQALIRNSSDAWAEAEIASGAEPVQARTAALRTAAFYSGNTEPEA